MSAFLLGKLLNVLEAKNHGAFSGCAEIDKIVFMYSSFKLQTYKYTHFNNLEDIKPILSYYPSPQNEKEIKPCHLVIKFHVPDILYSIFSYA